MNSDGFVTGLELALYLRAKVSNVTGGGQVPEYGLLEGAGMDRGDYIFKLSKFRIDKKDLPRPKLEMDKLLGSEKKTPPGSASSSASGSASGPTAGSAGSAVGQTARVAADTASAAGSAAGAAASATGAATTAAASAASAAAGAAGAATNVLGAAIDVGQAGVDVGRAGYRAGKALIKEKPLSKEEIEAEKKRLAEERARLEAMRAKIEEDRRRLASTSAKASASQPASPKAVAAAKAPAVQASGQSPSVKASAAQAAATKAPAAATTSGAAPKHVARPPLVKLRVDFRTYIEEIELTATERKIRRLYKKLKSEHPEAFRNRFMDNGDGSITDRVTGLMWQKGLSDRNASQHSPHYADQANKDQIGGASNWRLPTVEETLFLYLAVEDSAQIPIQLLAVNKGLWTADKSRSGYVFVWKYKGFLSKGLQPKIPLSGDEHHTKAVRSIR